MKCSIFWEQTFLKTATCFRHSPLGSVKLWPWVTVHWSLTIERLIICCYMWHCSSSNIYIPVSDDDDFLRHLWTKCLETAYVILIFFPCRISDLINMSYIRLLLFPRCVQPHCLHFLGLLYIVEKLISRGQIKLVYFAYSAEIMLLDRLKKNKALFFRRGKNLLAYLAGT